MRTLAGCALMLVTAFAPPFLAGPAKAADPALLRPAEVPPTSPPPGTIPGRFDPATGLFTPLDPGPATAADADGSSADPDVAAVDAAPADAAAAAAPYGPLTYELTVLLDGNGLLKTFTSLSYTLGGSYPSVKVGTQSQQASFSYTGTLALTGAPAGGPAEAAATRKLVVKIPWQVPATSSAKFVPVLSLTGRDADRTNHYLTVTLPAITVGDGSVAKTVTISF